MKDYKSFKDANGERVKIGGVVSVKGFDGTFIVKSIARSQRVIEVCLFCNVRQYHYYATSKQLLNEEF